MILVRPVSGGMAVAHLPYNSVRIEAVLADVRDNPGGGTAGDSTFLLRRMIERGITEAAFASIWDPQAVRICFAAGRGARLPLRFGGKASAGSGLPIDAEILVTRVVPDAFQTFRESIVPMGDCAAIRVGGIDVILASGRAQVFEPQPRRLHWHFLRLG